MSQSGSRVPSAACRGPDADLAGCCRPVQEARERYTELKPSAESDISLEVELRRTQQQLGDGDYENKPVPQVPQ